MRKMGIVLGAAMVAAGFATVASGAQVVVQPGGGTRVGTPVSLGCSAGAGDVAQTIYITNTTNGTLAKGLKINWVLGKAKGTKVLDADLAKGGQVSDLGPVGNGGTCKATYLK